MSAPPVVGLDLSIAATGLVDEDGRATTLTPPKSCVSDDRLTWIRDQIYPVVTHDVLVVIEGPVLRSSAAIALGLLHGAVRAMLIDEGVPYALVAPASLKKYATGKGNAGKPDMAVALYKRTELELGDDNQVDAWWLRAMGLDALGHAPVELPTVNREALAKVDWPVIA